MAVWTPEEFARMRDDRSRYLDEIANLEGGGRPTVEHRENGKVLDDRDEFLAHLKRNVAEIEDILSRHGEPFD